MEGDYHYRSDKKKTSHSDSGLVDKLFSWSLEDICNEDLYRNQVERIPISFLSVEHYFRSYIFPLLEETRAQLCSTLEIISSAPFAEIIAFRKLHKTLPYDVNVDYWRNRCIVNGKEPYRTLPGDIFIIADVKPETVSDLQRVGRTWMFAVVTSITEDEAENEDGGASTYFKVEASKDIEVQDEMPRSLFVIFLMNITPNRRIWNALHMFKNLKIIEDFLCNESLVEKSCNLCPAENTGILYESIETALSSKLNGSQINAIVSCLCKLQCCHKSSVELIWGPPGTGKTKTISLLLFTLLRMNLRILTCAPTNTAITELAARVLKLVKESFEIDFRMDGSFCSFGEILLFGNKDRLKVGSEIEEIYLDYRVERLIECFGPMTGWKHCFSSMIDFLENCVSQYHIFQENELMKEKECSNKTEGDKGCCNEQIKEKKCNKTEGEKGCSKSFIEYARDRFASIASPLRRCITILCTHITRSYLLEHNFRNMEILFDLLNCYENLMFQDSLVPGELEEHFSCPEFVEDSSVPFVSKSFVLLKKRRECLSVLKALHCSLDKLDLPTAMNKVSIMEFCFQRASLIFSTASSSYKLHSVVMEPLNLLVIDEAAQLKECESLIPLQLPRIWHAILFGDECQLQATVNSTVSEEAGFKRSLFERLSSLGHAKNLLNIQYRMHPSISYFPNSKFYFNQILDGPNVTNKSYAKRYLPGPMFGPYSFINIFDGREELDDVGYSRKNMVEVAAVVKIVRNLHKAWIGSRENLSVGVLSPYASQVLAIREKIGQKYENPDGFSVKVNSVDGFQGGEEDIIIISTVRSNPGGSIGFVSNPRRTNVALTRARYSLWILGNGRAIKNSQSIWEALVCDATDRNCFFNADDDKDLAKTILEVKKELDQFDDVLNKDSILFKSCRWKVLFSDDFKKSFAKLISARTKKSVINLLLKLSGGWRPKKRNIDSVCEGSSQILKQFKVEGLYLICTIDIIKESRYFQVLKVWDIMPLEEIPKLVKRLNSIFAKYTDDYINHCKEKCLERDLEIPKSWVTISDIIQFKSNNEDEINSNSDGLDGRSYVENSKVTESLLLMKFYRLSSDVVSQLLSGSDVRQLDLPFEVTDKEREIILFDQSTFILGRSGTGKTTVLTMKLFQKEKLHQQAKEAIYGVESNASKNVSLEVEEFEATRRPILRQLFVTVSPKLCFAVKRHVSNLKSFAHGTESSADISSRVDVDYVEDAEQFKDIPDTFVDIPPTSFPLVITFQKFLLMLDGTLGNSYFERFHDARLLLQGKTEIFRSNALQTFIRTREVNYDRFSSSYWPHFNTQLIKGLDSSRVFTEIMSHIKGGLRAGESGDGKLSQEDYILLSESRTSTLSKRKREVIYDIFQDYEKMKLENGEFDLADLVIDLHRRLEIKKYEGAEFNFVYVDEVQDLTMRQIALFKFVCGDVKQGFVFSGDTAQTIARGIDFRFQDIRSLFYNEFVLESRNEGNNGRKEKGKISEIFHLSQNFRTHAGILNLAQCIIDLIYRFFPQSIDVLSPETSLIYGEAPVLLESGNEENAIVTIFGNSGKNGSNFVGFGAEQVILVRDDCARKEISQYVGKQALVLTIVECKGLEFQDVLLYNFFSTSPLKNQWRVIYEFMREQNLLDASCPRSYPTFNEAKHNLLCSELKQLYVAITRTRQRLWISENVEEFCKPIFDYWKMLGLVRVQQLDDSLAQAMQVASSPEEWKSRGMKLLAEENYEMATMCFERAGDRYWERYAKAAALRATADRLHNLSPEKARIVRREAADLFDFIGKADSAAECFYLLEEFERAGRLYLEKCGESKLGIAGECFSRAGCYEVAAEVYAKGNFFTECLSVCTKGNLLDRGLQYIEYWKQHAIGDDAMAKRRMEMDQIEQKFLESCALHYYELKDKRAMMKFVNAFHSMDLKRTFLKTLDCLDELMWLEEESGNFLEAANIAKLRGDLLLEADLLGKGGHFKEASVHILWYVLANSLWAAGSSGWPLKQFTEKEELLAKVKAFGKNVPEPFYETVCTEASILSDEVTSLVGLKQYLSDSQRHKSLRGEILSARKILDVHFRLNASKYDWENKLVDDLMKHSEEIISYNHVSIETLVCYWNLWKEKVVNIFKYLGCLETQDGNVHRSYGEFCLNYMGVWRQFGDLNGHYILLNPDVSWLREIDNRNLHIRGKLVSIDVHEFVIGARSHWCSELFCVGMKVLETLEALYRLSTKNSMSTFCQTLSLIHMHEVAKYLLESTFLDCRYQDGKRLHQFLQLSVDHFFACVFPLDWRTSLVENMIFLRETESCRNLLRGIIFEIICSKKKLTYGESGRLATMILGSGKLSNEVENIGKGLKENPAWLAFIKTLAGDIRPDFGSVAWISLVCIQGALEDTFNANWRKEYDYMSPDCFLYLIERLVIVASCFQGQFFAAKSSFVEWLVYQKWDINPIPVLTSDMLSSLSGVFDCVADIVQQLLYNKEDTMKWVQKSGVNFKNYYPLLLLRLFVVLCLLCLNSGKYYNLLFGVLGRSDITSKLPREFFDSLRRVPKRNNANRNVIAIAEAFRKIENPLVMVSLGRNCAKLVCSDSILVDLMATRCREDIIRVLFPNKVIAFKGQTGAVELETANSGSGGLPSINSYQLEDTKLPSSEVASIADRDNNTQLDTKVDLPMSKHLWEIFDALYLEKSGKEKNVRAFLSNAFPIKVEMEKSVQLLTAALTPLHENSCGGEDGKLFKEASSMLDELKLLLAALDESEWEVEKNMPRIGELVKGLQLRRPRQEPFLERLFSSNVSNVVDVDVSGESSATRAQVGKDDNGAEAKDTNKNMKNSELNSCGSRNKGKGNNKNKKWKRAKGGRKK